MPEDAGVSGGPIRRKSKSPMPKAVTNGPQGSLLQLTGPEPRSPYSPSMVTVNPSTGESTAAAVTTQVPHKDLEYQYGFDEMVASEGNNSDDYGFTESDIIKMQTRNEKGQLRCAYVL